jgi:hypothetical protein
MLEWRSRLRVRDVGDLAIRTLLRDLIRWASSEDRGRKTEGKSSNAETANDWFSMEYNSKDVATECLNASSYASSCECRHAIHGS